MSIEQTIAVLVYPFFLYRWSCRRIMWSRAPRYWMENPVWKFRAEQYLVVRNSSSSTDLAWSRSRAMERFLDLYIRLVEVLCVSTTEHCQLRVSSYALSACSRDRQPRESSYVIIAGLSLNLPFLFSLAAEAQKKLEAFPPVFKLPSVKRETHLDVLEPATCVFLEIARF